MTQANAVSKKIAEANANCMEGLGASELVMIRRLAGNDSLVRKKTIRKLRKWLLAITNRLPDGTIEECRGIIEPNFIRVWKALFYCMWMADKPLPQEQLAEQLSGLLTIFKNKPVALLLFIEWFFRTMSREWPWIDRFRMDKFMMLIRRFLRSSLTQLHEEYKFKNEILDPFLDIFSTYVFNRTPTPTTTDATPSSSSSSSSASKKKTRAQLKNADSMSAPAPVGFQIHFVDIFMEEVAKVCGEDLKNKKLMRLLQPFITELKMNDDERLTDEIKEKVFHYLMRQSDVALDFEEGLNGQDDSDDDEDEEDMDIEDEDDDDEDQKDINEMVMETRNGKMPLDPRAGAIDVVLPQLNVDYADLAKNLVEAGGGQNVRAKNRKLLYDLAKGFESLIEGDYPLAVPRDTSSAAEKRAIKKGLVKQATVKLLQLEDQLIERTNGHLKKAKKMKIQEREGEDNDDDEADTCPRIKTRKLEKVEQESSSPKSPSSSPSPRTKAKKKITKVVVGLPKVKTMKRIRISSSPVASAAAAALTPKPKKRVSFVMARNLEHPHADYEHSIRRSPAIPFDANKQPNSGGLLKSPATPSSSSTGGLVGLKNRFRGGEGAGLMSSPYLNKRKLEL